MTNSLLSDRTHSVEFELPSGRMICIPPPTGPGWIEGNRVELRWPHRYINEKKWGIKVTHEEGELILREYIRQLKAENARVVSYTVWELRL